MTDKSNFYRTEWVDGQAGGTPISAGNLTNLAMAAERAESRAGYGDALRGWRAARADMYENPAKIVWLGDSITEGWFVADSSAFFPQRIGNMLAGVYAGQFNLGRGYVPASPSVIGAPKFDLTNTSGLSEDEKQFGLAFWAVSLYAPDVTSGGDYIEITVEADRIEVLYTARNVWSGSLKIYIDDLVTEVATVNTFDGSLPAGDSESGRSWLSAPLTQGAHTVRVEASTPDPGGTAVVDGIFVYTQGNYDKGPQCWNGGHFGYSIGNLVAEPGALQAVVNVDPDLVVLTHFHNSALDPTALFVADYTTVLEQLAVDVPLASVLLVAMYETASFASGKARILETEMRKLAAVFGVGYVSLSDVVGSVGVDGIKNDPYGLMSDNSHPTERGMAVLAEGLYGAVGNAAVRGDVS